MATGRRMLGGLPRFSGRAWEDVSSQLDDLLRKLWDSQVDGIPPGFGNEIPTEVTAPVGTQPGDPGTQESGWAAADHRHVAPSGTPMSLEIGGANLAGVNMGIARSDHVHKVVSIRRVGVTVDNYSAGAVVSTGFKGFVACPNQGRIIGWKLIAGQAGDCVFDVWKADYRPSVLNSICGGYKPSLTGEATAAGGPVGWANTDVEPGDIFGFHLDSVATLSLVTLVVEIMEDSAGYVNSSFFTLEDGTGDIVLED